MYKIFPLSLILRLDAIFTLAGHVQLKIMPIPLFKTKSYQILVSKPFTLSEQCQGFFYVSLPTGVHGYLKETRPMVSRRRAMTLSSDLKKAF